MSLLKGSLPKNEYYPHHHSPSSCFFLKKLFLLLNMKDFFKNIGNQTVAGPD